MVKVTTLVYIFWIPQYRFSTYRDHTQVSAIYTTRDIILNALCHVWPWISRTYLFEFPVIYLVIGDTKKKFMWHILPEISYWMLYVMFDLEFQGQRSRSQYWHIFSWIPWHQFSRNRHKNYVPIALPSRDIEYCLGVKKTPSGPRWFWKCGPSSVNWLNATKLGFFKAT